MNERVKHYIDNWNLSNLVLLANTLTGDVYRVEERDRKAVLKIRSMVAENDEHRASCVLKWFDNHGSVALLKHDQDGILLEYLEGPDLVELVADGRDSQAAEIIGGVINKLHSHRKTDIPKDLISLAQRFEPLLNITTHSHNYEPILYRGVAVARNLLDEQGQIRILHGDIHHKNVLYHPTQGWLAIDPKGIVGDRTYEAANALCSPYCLPEVVLNPGRMVAQSEILSKVLDLDQRALLSYAFVHSCLAACWSIESGYDPALHLQTADTAEMAIINIFPVLKNGDFRLQGDDVPPRT